MGGCHMIPIPIVADAASIGMLIEGVKQIGLAIQEIKEFQSVHGKPSCAVEFVMKSKQGVEIGVAKNAQNELEFVVKESQKKQAMETIKQIKQIYSKIKVLNELKRKGYQNVKEEKLADGSIKLVLQKWR